MIGLENPGRFAALVTANICELKDVPSQLEYPPGYQPAIKPISTQKSPNRSFLDALSPEGVFKHWHDLCITRSGISGRRGPVLDYASLIF